MKKSLSYPYLLWLAALCGLTSCADTAPVVEGVAGSFSLDSLMRVEQRRLAALDGPVHKVIEIDGERETQTLDAVDWARELEIFAKADINKPAWQGKFAVDSVFAADGRLAALHYRAADDHLKIRALDVYFGGEAIDSVVVHKETRSPVSQASLVLKYVPQLGYELVNRQKTLLSDEHILRISVTFPK